MLNAICAAAAGFRSFVVRARAAVVCVGALLVDQPLVFKQNSGVLAIPLALDSFEHTKLAPPVHLNGGFVQVSAVECHLHNRTFP